MILKFALGLRIVRPLLHRFTAIFESVTQKNTQNFYRTWVFYKLKSRLGRDKNFFKFSSKKFESFPKKTHILAIL